MLSTINNNRKLSKKDKEYRKALPGFGECVKYLPLARERGTKDALDDRMKDGIFVGIQDRSDECIVLTKDGATKARTLRRRPPSQRFQKELLEAVKGTPWEPTPG